MKRFHAMRHAPSGFRTPHRNELIAFLSIFAFPSLHILSCSQGSGFLKAENKACRGASINDNQAAHYVLAPAASVDACKAACLQEPLCSGVEYSLNRCEVWTRPGGIRAMKPLENFTCYTFQPAGAEAFHAVDGGRDRACRGTTVTDNSDSYMKVLKLQSLFECKSACLQDPECKGVEFSLGRCEVWTQEIQSSAGVEGFVCLALHSSSSFQLVNGPDQACRGSSPSDNSETYYEVSALESLELCQRLCVESPSCRGIEFSLGRCEIWLRSIESSLPLEGFTCMRRPPSVLALRARRRQRFLGPSFVQTFAKSSEVFQEL